MTGSKKLISFDEFKRSCEDKYFEQRSEFGYFIKCKLNPPFCNERVCVPWNKLSDAPAPLRLLREINQELANGQTRKDA